ncbi:protein BatD [candidate division WOR-3 bacterium]|nr:protein BatD [candidate division WOR-3 bacterium]
MKKILIYLILLIPIYIYADVNVKVSSEYEEVGTEENFNVTIEVSGNTTKLPNVDIGHFNNFDVIARSSSQNYSFINGKIFVSKQLIYTLVPKKEGNFTIGPFLIKHKKKEIKSNKIDIGVKRGVVHKGKKPSHISNIPSFDNFKTTPSQSNRRERYTVDFVADVNKKNVYKGEEIIITYRIIRNISFSSNPNLDFPEFKGFWREELKDKKPYYITKNGERYLVNELQFALFPNKTGKIKIEQGKLSGYINTFFIDPFSGGNNQIVRETEPITINVKPLPLQQDERFTGGIGDFTISDSILVGKIKVGEPVIREITIKGKGNLTVMQKPFTEYPPSFRIFDSKVEQNINRIGNISGSIAFKEMFIPQKRGKYVIQGIKFVCFNPSTGKYKEIETDSFEFFVESSSSSLDTGISDNIMEENDLIIIDKQVKGSNINKTLMICYIILLILLVIETIVLILRKYGIKLPIISYISLYRNSHKLSKIKEYEKSKNYKEAIILYKNLMIREGNCSAEFISESDKIIFKPSDITDDEYNNYKKKYMQ